MLRDGVVDRAAASERVAVEVEAIVRGATGASTAVLIVSNEVGHGLFPTTSEGRLFQELAGLANRRIAAAAGTVWTVTAGIATRIK
jgi:adenosylcobinamide kinase/adenosylcobinamide-phosphate guanylyltransferase